MDNSISRVKLSTLKSQLSGDLYTDISTIVQYSTDASAYREHPLAVVRPKNNDDIKMLIQFARTNQTTLIPRTAGTSLAGQVVGKGIIVDLSKYFTNILEINPDEKWVRVEPGVVLDELNLQLKKYGLFFGPETSTSNRCMMAGMVGNNSCGAHSIVYGSTRNHTLEIKAILSDGSEVQFKELSVNEFNYKCEGNSLESKIYKNIKEILANRDNQAEIKKEFPDPRLERRNTGYAIDVLLEMEPFTQNGTKFNFSKLICGSEGTLAFITEIKLNLVPLPPSQKGLLCVHMNSVDEALEANLIALKFNPVAIELIDDIVLECTKTNIEHKKNRFFIQGDPGALLCVEFAEDTLDKINELSATLEKDLRKAGFGYHFPLLFGNDISKVWALRKAGLGLLSNMPGDAKPQPVIEDTAVHPEYLPSYIKDFKEALKRHNLSCVFYAHIATGELHLRPLINLKTEEGVRQFRNIAYEIAHLVKKYNGSLSGEHGDGRLRGEFIPLMIGDKNYQLLKVIKKTWDPENIFNAGKITDTPRMDTSLRFVPGQETKEIETIFDFSDSMGFVRMAEKCNGSGDCRKSHIIGGTMCPSFQATRDEKNTTRARANILREYINGSDKKNPLDHQEIYDILDLCLSCKGCKSECPSNVDMAKLKAEFLQHYYDSHAIPLRTRLIAYISVFNKIGSYVPVVFNWVVTNKLISTILKSLIGFAKQRSIPTLYKFSFRVWLRKNLNSLNNSISAQSGQVYLFIDEFTNYNDTQIGIMAVKLLSILGYKVNVVNHEVSGRTFISKGYLRKARKIAIKNITIFKELVSENVPLVGIEPSAILSFRDEYPDLVRGAIKESANKLAKNSFTFEEFIIKEFKDGKIDTSLFTTQASKILLHGHCQQKAIASTQPTLQFLSIPGNYKVEEIKSGCCGMAGSFGYEKEHYDLSMKVGELVLFPEVRKADKDTIIAAPGTSCRHQIKDGTDTNAQHPIEILYNALI